MGLVVLLAALIAFVLVVHGLGWDWTGLTSATGPTLQPYERYRPAKTLWDWLQLLFVPLVLASAALLFSGANSHTEQKIALDKQREDLFQAYLDCMAELLLKEQLRSSAGDAEVRTVARARTITVLTQLDARRVGSVFAFLHEAGLMSTTCNDNVVSLSEAELREVSWSHANLRRANLSGADLGNANLSNASLRGANLRGANLSEASFSGADLSGADLSNAFLYEANLSNAFLHGADLSNASLLGADLSEANLSEANLSEAHLSRADLSRADLLGANLRGADLSEAVVTEEQLKKAKVLKGATPPDGSTHP